jgi:dTDP-4-amino-4,6-dideoxygalactose transaminase
MIPMGVPLLPSVGELFPYLEKIDATRWYTNGGPLLREYEARMGERFGCAAAAVSSCTSGLTAALIAQDLGVGDVMAPSWTFVATANAIRAAELVPFFVDVDEATWEGVGAELMVSPFGKPIRTKGMVDAAAAFDAYMTGQSEVGNKPVVISTHATKVFSTGEGGLVLSRDKDLIRRVKEICNHGLTGGRDVPRFGINGKMSEYHAAVGLAELDSWGWKRMKWLGLKERYVEAFGALAHTTPLSSLSWVGSTFCVRFVGKDGEPVRQALRDAGFLSWKVWGDGCHAYAAHHRREGYYKLPVTKRLAREVVFFPYSLDMTDEQIRRMADIAGAFV